jgi:cytochrome P450
VRRARRDLDAVIDSILDERASAPPPQSPDLLSVLMEAGADREQVRDEVRTFLVAGHDTISHALTWTWLLLSANHDADERLGREVAMVLGSRLPESSDVAQLTYTRAVVKESLRLWPPAWVIVRRAKHAMSIAGQDIPAGALVVASPFVTHRDERYFPDPHTFDPGRWLVSGGEAGRPKQAYFPFGAGPRACVGEHFAWLEATLVLATLAQQWRAPSVAWDMVHPVARVTLRPGPLPSFTPSRRKWRGQASYHSTGAEVPLSQAPGAADGP